MLVFGGPRAGTVHHPRPYQVQGTTTTSAAAAAHTIQPPTTPHAEENYRFLGGYVEVIQTGNIWGFMGGRMCFVTFCVWVWVF